MDRVLLIDNDIIIKLAAFQLDEEFLSTFENRKLMLGVGRYVVAGRIDKKLSRGDLLNDGSIRQSLDTLLNQIENIEPKDEDITLAAKLEEKSFQLNLELDTGESLLLAVLINQNYELLATGDKRAIISIHELYKTGIDSRIICFEQIIRNIALICENSDLQAKICSQENADKSMFICFSCSRYPDKIETIENCIVALESYILDLRSKTSNILC